MGHGCLCRVGIYPCNFASRGMKRSFQWRTHRDKWLVTDLTYSLFMGPILDPLVFWLFSPLVIGQKSKITPLVATCWELGLVFFTIFVLVG